MHMRGTGRERFDFQGGRPGVFRFKKGFSTENRGEFHVARRVHKPQAYDELVDAADAAGVEVDTDYFPQYRNDTSN
jgi:catechol 2,3-dioxygenase-like lactoylglutathione lyase family enzyme